MPPWTGSVSTRRTPNSRSSPRPRPGCSAGCDRRRGCGRGCVRPYPGQRTTVATGAAAPGRNGRAPPSRRGLLLLQPPQRPRNAPLMPTLRGTDRAGGAGGGAAAGGRAAAPQARGRHRRLVGRPRRWLPLATPRPARDGGNRRPHRRAPLPAGRRAGPGAVVRLGPAAAAHHSGPAVAHHLAVPLAAVQGRQPTEILSTITRRVQTRKEPAWR
jgi:hypothetical protein